MVLIKILINSSRLYVSTFAFKVLPCLEFSQIEKLELPQTENRAKRRLVLTTEKQLFSISHRSRFTHQ